VDDFDSADLESATMTRRRNAQINHAA